MFSRYRQYDRSGAGLLDMIFALAGGGRGVAGQVRIWSAIVLVLMGVVGLIAGSFVFTQAVTPSLTAAQIERGYKPRLTYRSRRGQTRRASYEITGRVSHLDSAAFVNQRVGWRCAPLTSQADSEARISYVATETSYRRSRAENRFVGELYGASEHPYTLWGATLPCDTPTDGYLLVDDGSSRTWRETSRSLLIIALVIGSIAAIAFLLALRKSSKDDATEA